MDVKQITARLNRGVVYEGMVQDIEDLLASGEISQAEHDELVKMVNEINSSHKEENTIVVGQEKEDTNFLEVSELESENQDINTLFTTITTEATADENVDGNNVTGENATSAENTDEQPAENENSAPETQEATSDSNESDTHEEADNNNNVAQWVSDYHNYMMEWSARNPDRRLSKFEAEENSFKAEFKDEVVLNFSSPSNVAVKTSDPDSPKASDFDALLEIAKKSNQDIKLSDKMSESFRKALIEACAKADVKIINLSAEDADLYMSFVPEEEETTINDNEKTPQEEAPAEEKEEPVAEEPVAEEPVAEEADKAPIAMPESFKDEDIFAEYDPTEEVSLPEDEVADENAETSPTLEAPAEEEKKENFFKRGYKKVKQKVKQKAPIVMFGVGTAATTLAGCDSLLKKQNKDPVVQEVNDTIVDPLADDTFQLTTESSSDTKTDTIAVPTEWNKSMAISEKRFNSIKRIYAQDWETVYKRAYQVKDTFGTTAEQLLSAYRTFVDNTSNVNAQGLSIPGTGKFGEYTIDLHNYLFCGKELKAELFEAEKNLITAGGTRSGDILVAPLTKIKAEYGNLLNDGTYLIFTGCNRPLISFSCGSEYEVKYELRDCDCGKEVTHKIEVVLQDTTLAQTPVLTDTAVTHVVEAPADTTKKVVTEPKEQEYEPELIVRYTTNLGKAPTAKLLNTFTTDETQINPGTKVGTKRWTTKNQKRGYYTSTTAEEVNEEVRNPGASKAKAAEKRKQAAQEQNYSYEENGNTYNWPVNQSEGR
ncbi:MAG: hypothetical protein J6Y53_05475 [Alphaproteobacteria bacterium]|nr:hypothetical protein [Alphaproteobacteria bacterium]